MPVSQEIVVRRHVHAGCIFVAEMCRPRAKNAFNDALYEQLTAALDDFESNASLHAFVLTGHGDYFTSGADVKDTAAILSGGSVRPPSQSPLYRFMHKMLECKKLLVAAVNGPAIGIGVTLLMHCDVVYAADSATFWTPFLRIGVVPEFASSYTFPHLLGPTVASNLVIRSKVYTAEEALTAKIVGEVFPTNGFLNAVLADLTPLVANRFNQTSLPVLPVYTTLLRRERAPKVREALFYEFEQLDRRAASGEFLATVMELKKQFNKNKSKL
ncbi:Enoyl-CoA hydratase/isomerase [Phytophthora megakarya]|uniref:Enoyl-CoA hydratase/isomerase n=1 Tax=Phytophthora megakarya TaxID=4795 RepID=A0A225X4W8_9STRA|nr:Enoyl-CoA hydratase/isomerase [Phytophthora megakarya]